MSDNFSTRMKMRHPTRRGTKRLRFTKKEKGVMKATSALVKHIMRVLKTAGVDVSDSHRVMLKNMIFNNGGDFTPEFIDRCGIKVDDYSLIHTLTNDAMEMNMVGKARQEVLRFDTRMEKFFRCVVQGIGVKMFFLKMRAYNIHINHVVHVRIENHWQLGRLIAHLEQIEKSEARTIVSEMFYHTAIDGLHLDCVPLVTDKLPVEWVISVKIPDCECGCANWEKRPFVGSDWI